MAFSRKFSVFVFLTSIVVYRSQYTLRNSIFKTFPFPDGYYAEGDVSTQCQVMADELDESPKYCEDETFWDIYDGNEKLDERKVVITCDANRKNWNTVMGPLNDPNPLGTLWVYSPHAKLDAEVAGFFGSKKPTTTVPVRPLPVTLENYPEGHDFHPLGIKIYPSYGGNVSNVYVVNHARQRTFIEHFTISPSVPTVAKYVRTLSSPYFVSPNALALTSPDSFYVTNDHLLTRRIPVAGNIVALVETILGLPLSWTAHVTLDPDPASPSPIQSHTFVAPFIPFSNGISISSSGERVAIASTSLSQINFYARNASSNALTFEQSVMVPFVPDNIDFDDNDALIVGGHPHFPTLVKVVKGKVPYAPSWVMSLSLGETTSGNTFDSEAPVSASSLIPGSSKAELRTLFQSNGAFLSSSSTGLRDTESGNLYVIGLYGRFAVCKPTAKDI